MPVSCTLALGGLTWLFMLRGALGRRNVAAAGSEAVRGYGTEDQEDCREDCQRTEGKLAII